MEKEISRHILAGEDYTHARVDRDIDANRKGSFELIITKDGKPVDAEVTHRQTENDFNFGANIFMYKQYDTDSENKRYEKEFTNLFNSAAIPLYWEGTEPVEGVTRYSADTPNDVYRRPPAEMVADFCEENNLRMKGHPLFWHEFIPSWLMKYPYSEIKYLIEKRFEAIAERFRDRCERFDVVNEPSRSMTSTWSRVPETGLICSPRTITASGCSTSRESSSRRTH